MLVSGERLGRIIVLSVGLFVLSQMWAQMAMEIQLPFAVSLGSVRAVLFF